MLQNVSANRANKRITKSDIIRIACVAFLPHFGGGTLQYANGNIVKKYSSVMALFCIQGTGNNKGKMTWSMYQSGISGVANGFGVFNSGKHNYWAEFAKGLTFGAEYDLDVIHKGLKIEAGEIKIVVNVAIYIDTRFRFSSGVYIKPTPSLWGFFIFNPKTGSLDNMQEYFHCNVVFTPRPGLFEANSFPA
ncbi:MAG: hypothetical protein LBB21_06345 [Holosporaceae bacterium]|jgi:hypothetical protein|nr:hypothetical protein [Holosporaceae bacterium]